MDLFYSSHNKIETIGRQRVFRILIIALIILVLADAFIPLLADAYGMLETEKIPTENFPSIGLYIEKTASEKTGKTKIVFLGDSLIYGPGLANDTIPAHYKKYIDKIKPNSTEVFNLAIPGSTIPQQYIIMKNTIGGADAVIFNINIPNLKEDRRDVTNKEIVYLKLNEKSDIEGLELAGNYSDIDRLKSGILENWNLYKYRHVLRYSIVKSETAKSLAEMFSKIYCCLKKDNLTEPRHFPDLSEEEKERAVSKFIEGYRNLTIDEASTNIAYLRKIADLAKSHNKTIIAIIVPVNEELNTEYNVIDRQAYADYISFIRSTLTDGNVILTDYNFKNYSIHSEYYTDSNHFTRDGNEYFAKILANDTFGFLFASR